MMIGSILIKTPLDSAQYAELIKEFPQYEFIPINEDVPLISLGTKVLSEVEVFVGQNLTLEEIALLPRLHWIHLPIPYLDGIALAPIKRQKNILVTNTREENIIQIGRFAITATLAFVKNLFNWKIAHQNPTQMDIGLLRQQMWLTKEKTFLQIGLGTIGTEIAKRAKGEGFKVIGAQELASFHPHCEKTYSLEDLPSILPEVDIVSLALPRAKVHTLWFDYTELEIMKEDSILLAFGSGSAINLDDMTSLADKFRGILLDAHFNPPIPCDHPLFHKPNVLITFESGEYPKTKSHAFFHLLTSNLRQFEHANYEEMKNLVTI